MLVHSIGERSGLERLVILGRERERERERDI